MNGVEAKRESTVRDFLEVVFRRKWVILGIVAAVTVIVVVLNMRQPAVYESSAKVLVMRGEAPGVFDRNVRTLPWEEEIASQIELIKSQVIADSAQKFLPDLLPPDYRKNSRILDSRLNAGVVTTSNVLWVTYVSDDPVFCEAAVNAVVRAYREYSTTNRTPPEMEDFFSSEIQRLKEQIEFWLDRKEKALAQWNVVDITDQRRTLLNRLDTYRADLSTIIRQRAEKEAAVAELERVLAAPEEALSAVASGLAGSEIEDQISFNLRSSLSRLALTESELSSKYAEQNPELRQVREQMADIRLMILDEIRNQVQVNRHQLEIVKRSEETLQGIIAGIEMESDQYPSRTVELDRIDAALSWLQKNYESILERHMEAKITAASTPQWTVTILGDAAKAARKKTRDYVRMALGPLFSLIVGLGLAFFVDNLDHSIKNVTEAEENLGLPVLTSFPDAQRK